MQDKVYVHLNLCYEFRHSSQHVTVNKIIGIKFMKQKKMNDILFKGNYAIKAKHPQAFVLSSTTTNDFSSTMQTFNGFY